MKIYPCTVDTSHPAPVSNGAEENEYELFLRQQMEQFEDDITEGRCYPEMPEGQFVRSK